MKRKKEAKKSNKFKGSVNSLTGVFKSSSMIEFKTLMNYEDIKPGFEAILTSKRNVSHK